MTDVLIYSAAFVVFFGVWWFIAKRMNIVGNGGLTGRLAVALLVVLGSFNAPSEASDQKNRLPHYASIQEMADNWSYRYQFEVESEDPLHVRVFPEVYGNDDARSIFRDNWRAAIDGLYDSYIHTDSDQIIVDVIPLRYKSPRDKSSPELLDEYTVTLEADREQALGIIKEFIDVSSLSELKEDQGTGRHGKTEEYSSLYSPISDPGLYDFIEKLSGLCSNDCLIYPPD